MPIPVLDKGWVELVDMMPNTNPEKAIVDAARVSYGTGTKVVNDDITLIRYLMRHRHTTPLEMVEFKFRVQVPMDTWRQWIRHRTANVNEYSTRYSEAIDERQATDPVEWRLQSGNNKQGSAGYLVDWPAGLGPDAHGDPITPGEYLSAIEADFHAQAQEVYQERLKFGIAKEQARKDLPLSTYTRAYWKIDLHNLLHFLSLRMDSHAQLEIREYADAIGCIVAEAVPNVWQAFMDYRLNTITLTALDQLVLAQMGKQDLRSVAESLIANKREREECLNKLERLGLLLPSLVSSSSPSA